MEQVLPSALSDAPAAAPSVEVAAAAAAPDPECCAIADAQFLRSQISAIQNLMSIYKAEHNSLVELYLSQCNRREEDASAPVPACWTLLGKRHREWTNKQARTPAAADKQLTSASPAPAAAAAATASGNDQAGGEAAKAGAAGEKLHEDKTSNQHGTNGCLDRGRTGHGSTESAATIGVAAVSFNLKLDDPKLLELEALASACTEMELDEAGALAALAGPSGSFIIKRSALTLGRCTESKGVVDVDITQMGLGAEAAATERTGIASTSMELCGTPPSCTVRMSRRQASLTMKPDGIWELCNTGRRRLKVDGDVVAQFGTRQLCHLSIVEIGDEKFLFMCNLAASGRVKRRSTKLL